VSAQNEDSLKAYKDQIIRAYCYAGFRLTPTRGKKGPVGFPSTPYRANLTGSDFPGNYGIVLGDEDFVLDIDPRNFSPSDEPFRRLCFDLGISESMGDTFSVSSGRGDGGFHLYFKKPVGLRIRSKHESYPGLEFKSTGLVMGPGSLHPETGKPYLVKGGLWPHQRKEIPKALLDMLAYEQEGTSPDIAAYRDDELALKRFEKFLENRAPGVLHQNSNDWTLKTALVGRDFGLAEDNTFVLMRDAWNERNDPPLPLGELRQIVRNAYRSARDGLGNKTAGADFDAVLAEDLTTGGIEENPEYLSDVGAVEYSPEALQKQAQSAEEAKLQWVFKPKKSGENNIMDPHASVNVANHFQIRPTGPGTGQLFEKVRWNAHSWEVELEGIPPWSRITDNVEWNDDDTLKLDVYFQKVRNWSVPHPVLTRGVRYAAQERPYHPIREWYESLAWDGTDRIASLFPRYAGVREDAYSREVSRCFMLGIVSRIMDPGCKFDTMPILEGPPGIYKSTFCKALAGGPRYYADLEMDPNSPNMIQFCQKKQIIEISDLARFKKSDVNAQKRFLSVQTDQIRLCYAIEPVEYKRQFVFIGTFNPPPEGYLTDITGNRRYWPMLSTRFDLSALKLDREQLFAEAYARWKRGEKNYITDGYINAMAAVEQDKRMEREAWADVISEWVCTQPNKVTFLPSSVIRENILGLKTAALNAQVSRRIATAMHILGWQKDRQFCADGIFHRGFKLIELTDSRESRLEGI
jgi:hypothetical protein